jgi:hypothetical protein
MAISQAITVAFKQDLMNPGANLESVTLKCALYDNTASLDQNTLHMLLLMKFHQVVLIILLVELH